MGENVPSAVPKYAIFYHFIWRRERNVISLLEEESYDQKNSSWCGSDMRIYDHDIASSIKDFEYI